MIDDFRSAGGRPDESLKAKPNKLQKTEIPEPDYANYAQSDYINASSNNGEVDDGLPQSMQESEDLQQKPGKFFKRLHLSWPPSKKEYAVLAVLVVLLGGSAAALTLNTSSKPVLKAAPIVIVKTAPKSDLVPSTLSGLMVSPSVNKQPVTAVMVENSTFARPQSGLSQAGVVFEALAEGGITRFMAVYQDTAPSNIGPIRSVRPYYEQWALGFDASIAHVGGSPDALADISTWNVRNLDEFYNGASYHRITTRQAPHNVYTSIAALNQLEASKGYSTSTFSGFPRKAEAPSKNVTAGSINLTLSGAEYNVNYTYSPSTNSYNRSEGGAAQTDANTNAQISPKVVIAMVVPLSQGALDSSDAYYSDYNVLGNGPVYVFQDGTVQTGSWSKASNTSQISFTSSNGQVIKLNPGQTWITAISSNSGVSYTP
jgi:hypothetical protein